MFWKLIRLVVWVAALADWARPWCPPRLGRGDDLLERLVLEPDVQDQVPLGDLVVDIGYLHRADVATQLVLDEVFLALSARRCCW